MSCMEFAGLWGPPLRGDQQALGSSAFWAENTLEDNISGSGVETLGMDEIV